MNSVVVVFGEFDAGEDTAVVDVLEKPDADLTSYCCDTPVVVAIVEVEVSERGTEPSAEPLCHGGCGPKID